MMEDPDAIMNWGVGRWKLERIRRALQTLLRKTSSFPHSAFSIATLILMILIFVPRVLWAVGATNEDSGSLAASFDQVSAPIGSVVWLTLDYHLPAGGRLPQKPEIEGLEGLSVLAQVVGPQQIRLKCLLDQLDPWQSGPIRLTYLDSSGRPQTLTAAPVAIQAVSNLGEKPEEAQLRPIRDIIPIRAGWRGYLLLAVAVAALVVLGLLIFRWYRKKQKAAGLPEYREPPHVTARKAILKLESEKYFEKGMAKTYYFIFSEILRRYLGAIRNFPAAEYTTEEIARHIKTEPDRTLLPLLQRADLVKFADSLPTPARKEEDIKAALAYIRETSPRLEPVKDGANSGEVRP
jgi:hypothetical protein